VTAIMPFASEAHGPQPSSAGVASKAAAAPTTLGELAAGTRVRRSGLRWWLVPGDAVVGLLTSAWLLPLGATDGFQVGLIDALVAGLWVSLLLTTRTYETRTSRFDGEDVRRVFRAGVGFAAAALVLVSIAGVEAGSVPLVTVAGVATIAGIAQRWIGTLEFPGLTRRASTATRVVVAGHRRDVTRVLSELRSSSRQDFEVAAVCVPGSRRTHEFGVPVSTGFASLKSAVEQHRADAVIVLPCRHVDPLKLRRLGWELESTGTRLFLAPGLLDVAPTRARMGYAGSLPLLHVRHAELRGARRVLKEVWERAMAALAMVLLAPLFLALVLLVRAESEGPAFFRQVRVGKGGSQFTMVKFRTMGLDAEQRRATLVQPEEEVLFKLRDDPRVTRVGRFLRRYSLDELPQLINVVRGEMALVGPRPPLPGEVALYAPDTHRRLAVKPGLTGLWQVSGRSDLSWEDSVRLDLRYVDNWSIGLDLRIIWRTGRAVLGHQGAY
jgi:exopolysaccharide biosynthesis polyprenyl glycosylphosphotransferase